jgi:UDPglucose 6-dehydrogenase
VVLGVETDYARSVMAELYAPFVRTGKPILFMDVASAELTKYAANAMLATRITLMNELANLCERVGANVDHVRRGVGTDSRIGSAFLFPGPGYGGSCFPKDVQALVRTGSSHGAPQRMLEAVHDANRRQHRVLFAKVAALLDEMPDGALDGATVAVWGLAFKPTPTTAREPGAQPRRPAARRRRARRWRTDPVGDWPRRAAATPPKVGRRAGDVRPRRATRPVAGADALVVAPDCNEYRHPNFTRIREALARPLVVDGRNLWDPAKMSQYGFVYASVGAPRRAPRRRAATRRASCRARAGAIRSPSAPVAPRARRTATSCR